MPVDCYRLLKQFDIQFDILLYRKFENRNIFEEY